MSDNWKYLGENINPLDAITGGLISKMFGTDHIIEDRDTGTMKKITTFGDEKVGDVIKEGGERMRDV